MTKYLLYISFLLFIVACKKKSSPFDNTVKMTGSHIWHGPIYRRNFYGLPTDTNYILVDTFSIMSINNLKIFTNAQFQVLHDTLHAYTADEANKVLIFTRADIIPAYSADVDTIYFNYASGAITYGFHYNNPGGWGEGRLYTPLRQKIRF